MIDREEAKALLGGPQRKLPDNPQTPEEILEAMKAASANYYREAIATNCHTFIEFTGLINEYIKICDDNLKLGIDFTQTSGHRPEEPALKIQQHQLDYINDKLGCIFPKLQVVKVEEGAGVKDFVEDYSGEAIMDRYVDPEEFNNAEPSKYW